MIELPKIGNYLVEEPSATTVLRQNKLKSDMLAFKLGFLLKEARTAARMTQEQLAQKTGTKKSYISRIERGRSEIQLSTLYRIIKTGLGKDLNISIS
ncbi:MAG: helix-turn-helix domain-containing protein [Proteobacteria bacterium]|nr:helix-turn-helix domain-containing protein [Pseudomonadota bacterium]